MRSVAILALLGLSACMPSLPFGGDPLDDVERLSEVELADDAETVAIAAPEPVAGQGFFARLLGSSEEDAPTTAASAPAAESADQPEEDEPAAVASTDEAQSGGGLFGLFSRVTRASAGGPGAAPARDPDEVAPATMQPFGVVGKTCGLSRSELGTRIARVSGYEIYDTFPNSTAARPHYITGFNDRCARQFTAALVLTGDVGTHEVVRYQGSGRNLPPTVTDTAYERIKGTFCGVSTGQPCGRRLDALARNTTFVTAYETFASSPVWADILLHGGEFIAVSVETR